MEKLKRGRVDGVHFEAIDWRRDSRGGFLPLVNASTRAMMSVGDVNVSASVKGAIRGLHFNTQSPQAKLVRVLAGSIQDFYLDLRKDSATYLHWGQETLQANGMALYVPEGLAHGFVVLEPAMVAYVTSSPYSPIGDSGIRFTDFLERTGHGKYIPGSVLSHRDLLHPTLDEFLAKER
jgi:dTDP-4-dehydrorhamnose 3,5-epimerase